MVGHILLYHPAIRHLKDSLLQGEFGPVTGIRSERLYRHGVRPFEDALWGFVPHDVSAMLYLLDRKPVTGQAFGKPPGLPPTACRLSPSVHTAVSFTLDFPGNVTAFGKVSWLARTKVRRLTIADENRVAVFDDVEPQHKLKFLDRRTACRLPPGPLPCFTTEPLRLECEHFLNCVRRNEKPLTDGRNGLAVVSVLNALEESMQRQGAPVRIGG
jgi:UDP-2-acetamido-3-amino-2,3-dideoxy-glucuronate N-acetyltransferase